MKKEKKTEFSKLLLIQESILIWIHTIVLLILAYICILKNYFGELPWLTAMSSLPWAAYAITQRAYYKKAQAENTRDGIIFESAMLEEEQYYDDSEAVG